ncbi:MAG: hypothetical protein E3J72_17570 [Planctomycetota bacterium]|nr:MAG: hypothetical protein E3J72_17570 [Planctomycetota bacterium]
MKKYILFIALQTILYATGCIAQQPFQINNFMDPGGLETRLAFAEATPDNENEPVPKEGEKAPEDDPEKKSEPESTDKTKPEPRRTSEELTVTPFNMVMGYMGSRSVDSHDWDDSNWADFGVMGVHTLGNSNFAVNWALLSVGTNDRGHEYDPLLQESAYTSGSIDGTEVQFGIQHLWPIQNDIYGFLRIGLAYQNTGYDLDSRTTPLSPAPRTSQVRGRVDAFGGGIGVGFDIVTQGFAMEIGFALSKIYGKLDVEATVYSPFNIIPVGRGHKWVDVGAEPAIYLAMGFSF